jgi:hypothetical protein
LIVALWRTAGTAQRASGSGRSGRKAPAPAPAEIASENPARARSGANIQKLIPKRTPGSRRRHQAVVVHDRNPQLGNSTLLKSASEAAATVSIPWAPLRCEGQARDLRPPAPQARLDLPPRADRSVCRVQDPDSGQQSDAATISRKTRREFLRCRRYRFRGQGRGASCFRRRTAPDSRGCWCAPTRDCRSRCK